MKVVIFGNSGSDKTTMAARLAAMADEPLAVLPLDAIAWDQGTARMPIEESRRLLQEFIQSNEQWIIEGCYSDLLECALPWCDDLRFLNPGVATCLRRARLRKWEPEKFACEKEQRAMLDSLREWIAAYETRTDEFGLARHRALFDAFPGPKREYKGRCIDEP